MSTSDAAMATPQERVPGPYDKPRPNIDKDIAPFWEGIERGEFLLLQCQRCDAYYWPASYCIRHDEVAPFMEDMAWVPASGRGKVFAFNIHHWAFDPRFKDDIPYVYALIELDEGPMFGTNVVGIDPHDLKVGDEVEIFIEHYEDDDVSLPKARPVTTGSQG